MSSLPSCLHTKKTTSSCCSCCRASYRGVARAHFWPPKKQKSDFYAFHWIAWHQMVQHGIALYLTVLHGIILLALARGLYLVGHLPILLWLFQINASFSWLSETVKPKRSWDCQWDLTTCRDFRQRPSIQTLAASSTFSSADFEPSGLWKAFLVCVKIFVSAM